MTDEPRIPNPGAQVIFPNATGLEKAAADVDGERLIDMPAELIIDVWDPYRISRKNLPFLAWAYDVDLWEDGWSEATQREWVARQIEFKTIRGTIESIRMALDFAGRDFAKGVTGYNLVQYITPPQQFWLSPEMTPEEYNNWIHLMPEIRVYLGSDLGTAGGDIFLAGEDDAQAEGAPSEPPRYDVGFLDDASGLAYDNGRELYGRKAILRQAGKSDIKLKVIQRSMITAHFVGIDWEEIRNIGASESGMFLDVDGLDTEAYLDSFEVPANTYNVKVQTAFDAYSTQLMLSTVVPTQEPIYLTVQRNSDIGDAGPWMFLDDGFLGEDFATRDDADLLIADRLWLLDKDVSVPMTEGLSFLDVDRFGIGPYRMELLVDLKTESRQGVAFLDADFTEDAFLVEEDSTDIDRAIRAIRAAKSLRDKAGVRFDPLRPLIPSDKVTETTQTSDWFPNSL